MSTYEVGWNGLPAGGSDVAASPDPLPRGALGAGPALNPALARVPLTVPLLAYPDVEGYATGVAANVDNGAVDAPGQSGVNTLRAILLRGQTPTDSTEARLAAIEQRLDALAQQPAPSGAPQVTQLASLEQRIAGLTTQVANTQASVQAMAQAPAGLATAAAPADAQRLASVEHQVADLRLDHDQLAANATAFANELDQACRLRQRRVRVANRLELQRLRRQVYAPPGAFASGARAAVGSSVARGVVVPAVQPVLLSDAPEAAVVVAGVPDEALSASAPHWPLPRHVEAVSRPGVADAVVLRTASAGPLDAAGAWYAVRHAALDLALALWALLVVVAHLIAEDVRATWEWVREEWRGHRQ